MGAARFKFDPELKLRDLGEDDILCPCCGYNLRGIEGPRCPECGREFEWEQLRHSQVPWAHRLELGWFQAFWRTVWFNRKQACYEIQRLQDLADARKFRWLVILHVFAFGLTGWLLVDVSCGWGEQGARALLAIVLSAISVAICTEIPGDLCWVEGLTKEHHERAAALSMYSCGTLGNFVIPVGLLMLSALLEVVSAGMAHPVVVIAAVLRYMAGGLVVFILLSWLGDTATTITVVTSRGFAASVWVSLVLLLFWLFIVFGIAVLPLMILADYDRLL